MKDQLTIKRIENSWKRENSKYIYWILGAVTLFVLVDLITLCVNHDSLSVLYRRTALMLYFEILFIPLFTVNFIFLFKQKFNKYCSTSFKLNLLKLVALILGITIATSITEYFAHLAGVVDDDFVVIGTFKLSSVTTNFVTNIFFGLVIGLPIFAKQSSEDRGQIRLLEKERELNKAYELKMKSELMAIQAKINPHFLYNSLNSIVSLIHEDTHKAEKMVLSLSDLFRHSINSSEGNFSTVKTEIELVRCYLEIEQIRFQDQLKVEINVDEKSQNQLIPKFLIQPLIENAIKHGTSKITKGIIKLKIMMMDHRLLISVFDNGPLFPDEIDSGYGLKSTVDKLDLLYGKEYSFKILNEPEKKIEICLTSNPNNDVKKN